MSTFLILITYTASLDDVDELMKPHVAWLREQHEAGHFFAWGRKIPRDGGVVLARGESRAGVEALAAGDPFVVGGVAKVAVIEWAPSFAAEGFEGFNE